MGTVVRGTWGTMGPAASPRTGSWGRAFAAHDVCHGDWDGAAHELQVLAPTNCSGHGDGGSQHMAVVMEYAASPRMVMVTVDRVHDNHHSMRHRCA